MYVFWCMSCRILLGRREVVLTIKVCWLVSEPSRGDCGKSALQRTTMATLTRTPARPAPIRTVRAARSLRVPSRAVKQAKVRSFPFTCSSGLLERAQMQEEPRKKKNLENSMENRVSVSSYWLIFFALVCWPVTAFCFAVYFFPWRRRGSGRRGERGPCI